MNHIDEKSKRVKYIRALERFAKSTINSLKRDDFDALQFKQRIEKNSQILYKLEYVYLDSPYSKALEEFVNLAISCNEKDALLKSANQLEKLKTSRNYKKEKHRKKFKEDL